MGSSGWYHPIRGRHLFIDAVYPFSQHADGRWINSRRIKSGGGPVRYTGWTAPTYNQSPQQYGYTGQDSYGMNNYPPGQGQYPPQGPYGEPNYAGQPQYGNQGQNGPAYYDPTQGTGQG